MRIDGTEVHKSVTTERVTAAAHSQVFDLEDPGFCVACGEEQSQCDPDLRGGECEVCDQQTVYGAMELVIEMVP